jgi:hypothetical protein
MGGSRSFCLGELGAKNTNLKGYQLSAFGIGLPAYMLRCMYSF